MITVKEAIELLDCLGMPGGQRNERSALTLLALLGLTPKSNWNQCERRRLGVTPIMEFVCHQWGKEYAPNTRETFRRQTLHQFVEGGIVVLNPDDPERPINSPKTCYEVTDETYQLIRTFKSADWEKKFKRWQSHRKTLAEKYSRPRNLKMVPVQIEEDLKLTLSPGEHSKLIKSIIEEFAPRFAPGSKLIYLGDTGAKEDFFDEKSFELLHLDLDKKGKLPDVVLIQNQSSWIFLIESVTSHGPVDEKRYIELKDLFRSSNQGLIFVSAFPDRKTFNKFFSTVAWETEVWLAEFPDHLIHFNGDRFIGPREET